MPDMTSLFLVLALTAAGFLCGFVGLVLGLFTERAGLARGLGTASVLVGVLAPGLCMALLRGQLEWWCYVAPAAPVVPGVLALAFARERPATRGFPVLRRTGGGTSGGGEGII